VDSTGRIYTSTFDGKVRIHAADGSVVSDPFLSGLGNRLLPIALGNGGPWGTDLYTVNQFTGELIRANAFADTTVIGTGFDGFLIDFEFGPDGALYVSDLGLGRIWRIAPTTTDVAAVPAALGLRIEHPNPARAPFPIRYTLPAAGPARLRIYDLQGRSVRTLVEGGAGAGEHRTDWDGRDGAGQAMAAGVYWCRLEAGRATQASKILLLP
ncbi:MAG TPA: FlgD immunoglobulin-like domain containing protein, partial [Candidatus Udaeobacter sp.]|nr:FlgD immunoglobulin-like domain containing protein [Candidatus Udaeobacter sp.]